MNSQLSPMRPLNPPPFQLCRCLPASGFTMIKQGVPTSQSLVSTKGGSPGSHRTGKDTIWTNSCGEIVRQVAVTRMLKAHVAVFMITRRCSPNAACIKQHQTQTVENSSYTERASSGQSFSDCKYSVASASSRNSSRFPTLASST